MNRAPLRWPVRAAWGIAGLGWFLWVGYEDRGPNSVLVVAALLAGAAGLTGLHRWSLGRELALAGWVAAGSIVGGLSGLGTAPLAALLMVLKVALHSHPETDFTLQDVGAVLVKAPVWAVAGALLGASLALLSSARQTR